MKKVKRILVVLFLCAVISTSQAEQVHSVHDGDTFSLKREQTECLTGAKPRRHQSIRLFGIDAPEIDQTKGLESRDALQQMILGKNIKLECPGCSFHRQACHVTVDGKNIESEMVRQGWAYDSPRYSRGAYAQDESFAKRNRLGVWKQANGGVRPWDWRKSQK